MKKDIGSDVMIAPSMVGHAIQAAISLKRKTNYI